MRTKMGTWQITQIFLSDTGVCEVDINFDSLKLRCSCPGFGSRRSCKHTRFVDKRMKDNGGVYPTEISSKAGMESAMALHDPEAFRKLLINYGKIEVV